MTQWDGKSRGPAKGYQILLYILRKSGRIPLYIILYPLVFYYYFFSRKAFVPAFWYFRRIQRFSFFKSLLAVYRNYYSLGVALVDKFSIYSMEEPGFTVRFTGESNLREFTSGERGGILLSAHAGSWEMAGHFLKKYDTKVNLVLLEADDERIRRIAESSMVRYKENKHLNKIPIRAGSFDHIFAVREALERNELVIMNADRFTEENKTYTVKFMGREARFPAGPFQLAALYRVPVTMVFGFKESANGYHLYGIPPVYPQEGESRDEYAARALNHYISELENKVKQYPYQWYNFYYFWNKP